MKWNSTTSATSTTTIKRNLPRIGSYIFTYAYIVTIL